MKVELTKEIEYILEEYRKYARIQGTTEYGLNDFLVKGGYREEFEVGKWYKFKYGVACFASTYNNVNYGIYNTYYGWTEGIKWCGDLVEREATDQEVEEVLITEAKRRGFGLGVIINNQSCGYANGEQTLIVRNEWPEFEWDCEAGSEYGDFAFYGTIIFQYGKWAEIVEEIPVLEKEIFSPLILNQVNDRLKAIEDTLIELTTPLT